MNLTGTVVADAIVPLGSNPTHYDSNGQGSWSSVATYSELENITVGEQLDSDGLGSGHRKVGMSVWIVDESKAYILDIPGFNDINDDNERYLALQNNDYWTEFKTGSSSETFTATYTELVTMVTNSALLPGAYYIISDYQTVVPVKGTTAWCENGIVISSFTARNFAINGGEQIKIQAFNTNSFLPAATSIQFPNDVLTYDFNIKVISGKSVPGMITYRKDTVQNISTYYDFRTVRFRRYKVLSPKHVTLNVSGNAITGSGISTSGSSYRLNIVKFNIASALTLTTTHKLNNLSVEPFPITTVQPDTYYFVMWNHRESKFHFVTVPSAYLTDVVNYWSNSTSFGDYNFNYNVSSTDFQDYLTLQKTGTVTNPNFSYFKNITIGKGSGSDFLSSLNNIVITEPTSTDNITIEAGCSTIHLNRAQRVTIGAGSSYIFSNYIYDSVIGSNVYDVYAYGGRFAYNNIAASGGGIMAYSNFRESTGSYNNITTLATYERNVFKTGNDFITAASFTGNKGQFVNLTGYSLAAVDNNLFNFDYDGVIYGSLQSNFISCKLQLITPTNTITGKSIIQTVINGAVQTSFYQTIDTIGKVTYTSLNGLITHTPSSITIEQNLTSNSTTSAPSVKAVADAIGSVGTGKYKSGTGTNSIIPNNTNNNVASGENSVVLNGHDNTVSSDNGTVAGYLNTNDGLQGSSIAGGVLNHTTNYHTFIGAGIRNNATGAVAVIVGGGDNQNSGPWGFIGGGYNNILGGYYATIAGGYQNTASGSNSAIAGGTGNEASGANSFVGGGQQNKAYTNNSVIAGGQYNYNNGLNATIGGGDSNYVRNQWATIAGGAANNANGFQSTIGGGYGNLNDANTGTIAGGSVNVINSSGSWGFIGGGVNNTVSGNYSSVLGGAFNSANGNYVTIYGGASNTVTGEYGSTDGHGNNIAGYDNHAYGCANCTIPVGTENITLVNCQNFTAPSVNNKTYINNQLYVPGGGGGSTIAGATDTVAGIAKLYNNTGTYTDGGITPAAVSTVQGQLQSQITTNTNSITTNTNSISTLNSSKAPINSPSFTGYPTAPTQSPSTLGNYLATVDYVQQSFSGTASRVMAVSYDGTIVSNSGASNQFNSNKGVMIVNRPIISIQAFYGGSSDIDMNGFRFECIEYGFHLYGGGKIFRNGTVLGNIVARNGTDTTPIEIYGGTIIGQFETAADTYNPVYILDNVRVYPRVTGLLPVNKDNVPCKFIMRNGAKFIGCFPGSNAVVVYESNSLTPADIKSTLVNGSFSSGLYQGTDPVGSKQGMQFVGGSVSNSNTYKYEYILSPSDTNGTLFIWTRFLMS